MPALQRLAAPAVYIAGAAAYYAAVELFDMDFDATPGFLGSVMAIASIWRRESLAPAIMMICWGIGVLLVHDGPLEHEGSVFLASFGIGMAVVAALSRWLDAPGALWSAAIIMISSGAGYYWANENSTLFEPWPWALAAGGVAIAAADGRRAEPP